MEGRVVDDPRVELAGWLVVLLMILAVLAAEGRL
jgi:hypothetical protein